MLKSHRAALLGLATAAIGIPLVLANVGIFLELGWLFNLRGPIKPPPDVVVVSINKSAAHQLGLPSNTSRWPRSLHARLIDRLVSDGASAIAWDVFFEEPRSSEEDKTLAAAIQRARRVALVEYIERKPLRNKLGQPVPIKKAAGSRDIFMDQLVLPIPELSEAAMGLGPFPLPRVPARVHQFWAFKDDRPTLPVVTLQIHALDALGHLVALLESVDFPRHDAFPRSRTEVRNAEHLRELMRTIRLKFKEHPEMPIRLSLVLAEEAEERLSSLERRLLAALVRLYRGADSHYLNFYGPPGTIPTIPYDKVLALGGSEIDLAGKVVFVGASELASAEQKDDFYTVFRRPDGVDLSGVEIAATAFANLLTDRCLRPVALITSLTIVLLYGGIIGALAFLVPGVRVLVVTLGLALLYFGSAQFLFTTRDVWIPVFVPLLVQFPSALFLGLFSQYRIARRDREKLRRSIGPYVADRLVDIAEHELEGYTEQLYGSCLRTDVEGSTKLAKPQSSQQLAPLMKDYFRGLSSEKSPSWGLVFGWLRSRLGFESDSDHSRRSLKLCREAKPARATAVAHPIAGHTTGAGTRGRPGEA